MGKKDWALKAHRFVRDYKPYINNLYNMKTSLESKGSDRVVSDNKSDLDGSKVRSEKKTVDRYNKMALWSKRKSKTNLTGGKTLVSTATK